MSGLKPGEINIDLIPDDWALTPIGANKAPYLNAWQNHPQDKKDIKKHLESGKAKAVGLIAGNHYNNPFHLVWIDIDGESVWPVIKEMSGLADISDSLPPTLTICSGKPGRERRLYKVSKDSKKHLLRSKYATQPVVPHEKLEILCGKNKQGVLMGMHPDTEGYFTKENLDFRYANNLPELPSWILSFIRKKNLQFKTNKHEENHHRMYSPEFAVDLNVGYEHQLYNLEQALKKLAEEGQLDDYDAWIESGMAVHSFDDSLYELWDKYSQYSDKYDPQVTLDKWKSFTPGPIKAGTLFHKAKELGFQFNASAIGAFPASDALLEAQAIEFLQFQEEQDPMAQLLSNAVKAAQDYERDSGFVAENRRQKKNAPDNQIVMTIAGLIEKNIVFSRKHNTFMEYSNGVWRSLDKTDSEVMVEKYLYELASTLLPNGWDNNRVMSITKSLSRYIQDEEEWNPNPDLRCFENLVVNIKTLETMEHSPKYRLTRKIPYAYDPTADCPEIKKWLNYVQYDDQEIVEVLRAWLRACLTNAYQIQRFLEIVGPGKTGKTTFTELCTALVGMKNTVACDFENLRNRFEMARFIDASLCTFSDVDRYSGDISNFKKMTGGDALRAEHKNSSTKIPPFYLEGLVIVTANELLQTPDSTSGLKRRRLTVFFNRRFTGDANEQVQLINNTETKYDSHATGKFAPELPGLINWLLQMSEERMRSLLIDTNRHSAKLKAISEDVDASTNLQKKWLLEKVVYNPAAATAFGNLKDNREQGAKSPYKYWNTKLYANYCDFAHSQTAGKSGAMNLSRFKDWLLQELQHVLNLNVEVKTIRGASHLTCISLRDSWPEKQEHTLPPGEETHFRKHLPVPNEFKNDMTHAEYRQYPTVYQASEEPEKWEQIFKEWGPSLPNKPIKNS